MSSTFALISSTDKPPPTPPTPPMIKEGSCHYCDICPFPLPVPSINPPSIEKKNCSQTTTSSVRCMTQSIKYIDTDRGERSRGRVPKNLEEVRSCLSDGTLNCLQTHIELTPNDAKCLKVEGVKPIEHARYKACLSEARTAEGKKKESPGSTKTGEYTVDVDITVCSCTGDLCNNHNRGHLDSAELADNEMGSSTRLVVTWHEDVFITVFTLLIFLICLICNVI